MDISVHEQLLFLEKQLLAHNVRKSKDHLDKILADDFVEFGSSGIVFTKKDIIDRLSTEEEIDYVLTNFHTKILEENVVLTTFEIEKNAGVKYTLRSSIWRKTDGKWQIVFHQGTPK
ncbi:nuclear transport factor 2 family protein [Lottiidibacillus patelloidae]|uniref:nuclear transport factor 2 family protein n=1 Tax=Lottiidibacillus patelloidae TaxID=2670334 RepID=UPI001E3564BB|nr:DUF4440 domain-containing protein [Lottiidibacillus patelloidae]